MADSLTLLPEVKRLREFDVEQLVMVGDRGMISTRRSGDARTPRVEGVGWISALKGARLDSRALCWSGRLPPRLSLFDVQPA
ncbi:hypothetical protein [Variovorax sp. WS11]|uniref:hypothetical protein n=1 Tax=Variovorax sp. WS11 TaxID=1105204 RepID=UPI0013DCAF49|nr:hypothetical protein [Variovorax sp. WS11]NDZ15395.1 hypothetical protein [Variovorax sp. WS11]